MKLIVVEVIQVGIATKLIKLILVEVVLLSTAIK